MPGTGCSPRYKHGTPKTGIDLTKCSEGTWTALPTPGLMRKELKNRWRFLWSMLVNHSDCPGNCTIRHLLPVPQSRFLSPLAPLTSSCLYIFFEIPWMKNESSLPANTGLNPFQVSHSFKVNPLRAGHLLAATPATISTPPRKECFRPRSTACRKNVRNERREVLGWAGNGTWNPRHKLCIPVRRTVRE